MADEDISVNLSEWQQIPSPYSPRDKNNDAQFSRKDEIEAAATEITTLPLTEDTTESNDDHKDEGDKWLKKNLRELSGWVVQLASKIRNYATSKLGIGTFTSNTSRLLAVLLASLFYWMMKKSRRQRHIDSNSKKLMLLIQEKDQKINQLSLQISRINESLLTRRKVPVLQVG